MHLYIRNSKEVRKELEGHNIRLCACCKFKYTPYLALPQTKEDKAHGIGNWWWKDEGTEVEDITTLPKVYFGSLQAEEVKSVEEYINKLYKLCN